MNPQILQAYHSYLHLFDASAMGKYRRAFVWQSQHTRGEDIFKIIDGFFNDNSLSWDKCAGICTDGAAACTGINYGIVKRVKDKTPNLKWTHCFVHRQALVAKSLSEELHNTLNCVIKCVNYSGRKKYVYIICAKKMLTCNFAQPYSCVLSPIFD